MILRGGTISELKRSVPDKKMCGEVIKCALGKYLSPLFCQVPVTTTQLNSEVLTERMQFRQLNLALIKTVVQLLT